MTRAYLLGVLHDATERKTTFRIAQKSKAFVDFVARGIKEFGQSAWIYKEGKKRSVYIVEFSKMLLRGTVIASLSDKIEYIRGYFDAEGGIARKSTVRYYLYFAQKNLEDLQRVKSYLEEVGIRCGATHCPSARVDPRYFRFYIRAISYRDFAEKIGSWHPVKRHFLRVKI
jgi:intein-encoded DNA endonuclease-like protein